jgi:hypothetical protein
MAPEAIASAIRSIVDLPYYERQAWRIRLAATARERYSWPIAAGAYATVVRAVEAMDAPRGTGS